jgi:SAM-dependent methyltransferase
MRNKCKIKKTPDGRALLNLGCGTIMDRSWNNLDFSPYAFMKNHKNIANLAIKVGLLSKERRSMLAKIDPSIVYWDLRRGIPFANRQFDAVYMSNVLEHFDLNTAIFILKECHRILKAKSVVRIVTPNFEALVKDYTDTLEATKNNSVGVTKHLFSIANIFEQITRDQLYGIKHQAKYIKVIENSLRKNARVAGEAHRWMFDETSLSYYLKKTGFGKVKTQDFKLSEILGFSKFKLESQIKPSTQKLSLYIEGIKNE